MANEISFDLSPDHTRAFIFKNGRVIACLHADVHDDDKNNLWITLNECSEDANERREFKPLAYMTGYNSMQWSLRRTSAPK